MLTPRKAGLLFGLLAGLALVAGQVRDAAARGRDQQAVLGTYRDEGNTGIPFNTSCGSTSWTLVVSSDSIRRALFIQSDPDLAAATVCLSTTTNSSDLCNEGTPGVKLSTGAALSDYSGIAWECRARSGTVLLNGYWTRDVGDYGAISDRR